MKKICVILAALMLLTFGLAACGDTVKPESSSEPESKSASAEVSSEPASAEESSLPAESSEEPSEEPSKEPPVTPVMEFVPMTFTRKYGTCYINTSNVDDGHTVKLTMINTSWGTWNLSSFSITDAAGKTTVMTGAGTDWEYVFRVGQSSSSISFCGGNHQNEKLIDIKFYDASSGNEINEENKEYAINGLLIIENTQIYFASQPENPFVNVTRKYTINGADMYLECDFDFIQDAYFNLSYTCMFPVQKSAGNHILYNNIDGTTSTFDTALSGTKSGVNFGSDFDYGHKASSVEIWGDNSPQYRMHVAIYDDEVMADNYSTSYNTFFWDMSSTQNKLYFSKFDMAKVTKVEKDTHWDTLESWNFYVAKDAE